MRVIIGEEEYEYLDRIVDNESIRFDFIQFIKECFGFDFSKWYQLGYWTDKYEPHVLVKDNRVVATITANQMKYLLNQKQDAIQIGGVLTREAYRGKGLSRWLMMKVLEKYRDQVDYIFLFSDDVAVDFYPKMGFRKITEYIDGIEYIPSNEQTNTKLYEVKQLNLEEKKDRDLMVECYRQSNPFSAFPSVDCEELVIFYGLEFKKDSYYYIPELRLAVIAKMWDRVLEICDIYGKTSVLADTELLNSIIGSILEYNDVREQSLEVSFGFSTRNDLTGIVKKPLIVPDDTTFILGCEAKYIEMSRLRFPVLSHN